MTFISGRLGNQSENRPLIDFGTNAIWRRQIQRCRNWSGSTPSVRFRRRYSPGSPAGRLFSPQTGRLIRLGADKSCPYGGKRPVPVIASQCAHWRGNPHLPSLFSMFSNGNLKTPTFSIFNFQLSILSGRAGEHGRLRAVPTGARGGVHVANNVRRYGRAAAGGARGRQIAGATGGRGERGRLRAVPTGGQAGGDADGCGKWISRISVCVRFCVLSCVPSYVLSYVLLCVLLYRCARRLKGLQLRKNYQKKFLIRISVGISFPFLPGFSRFLHISGKTGQTIASKTPKH